MFNASFVYDSRVNFYYWDIDHVLGTVVEEAPPLTNHSITLTGLSPGTMYYFRVQSQDPSGIATSKIYNITIPLEGTTSIIDVSSNPAYKSEVRFTWVGSASMINPNWDLIAQTSKDYGIDVIIVELMSSTHANYPSNYVPHQLEDQLAEAVAAAHARGMQLYICMSVLLSAFKDEYKVIAANGTTRDWTDPTNPLARAHIKNLVEEVVSNYDIDGFMFDYARYDSADVPYGPYAKQQLEAYLNETITNWPGDFAPGGSRYNEFMEWRVHAIDELVEDMRDWMLAIKPNLKFSAAVWGWIPGWPTFNRYWIGQDFVAWVKEGYLDFVAPMMYNSSLTLIEGWVQDYLQYGVGGPEGQVPLVTFLSHTYPKVISPLDFKSQVDTVRSLGADGWSTWRYGGPGDGERLYNLRFSKAGYYDETRWVSFPTLGEYIVNVSMKPTTATISGIVTDSGTGIPIAGVNVTVDGQSTLTASDGTYSLIVRLGSYNLMFSKFNYYTYTTTVDCPTEGTYTVNVSLVPVPHQPPINYGLVIEDMDEDNKLYAMRKFYHFTAKAYDADGDLSAIKIAFTDGVTWANFSFTTSDRAFIRLSGYLIAELNETDCGYEIGGEWVNVTFSIRIKYVVDEAPDIELYQLSEDSAGSTAGWQTMQIDYASITKANVSAPGGEILTMTLAGTVASTFALLVFWKKHRRKNKSEMVSDQY